MAVCEYTPCGKEFQPKRKHGRFCSDDCRLSAHKIQDRAAAVRSYLSTIGRKGAAVTNAKRWGTKSQP